MMQSNALKAKFISKLSEKFDLREAEQIARAIIEDIAGKSVGDPVFVDPKLLEEMEAACTKVLSGYPLAYVTGIQYFYGRSFKVNSHVLIPRPETEELVYTILQNLKKQDARILDIGTGSGCISITLKIERPTLKIEAIDLSLNALKTAEQNAKELSADIQFHQIDFLKEEEWNSWESLDVIVSNPPYIGNHEDHLMSDSARMHEPKIALIAEGDDPLIFYRKIAKFGLLKLSKGAQVFVELNEFKAEETEKIFIQANYSKTELVDDLQGKKRILIATV